MAIFATQNPQSGETGLGWSEAQTAAQTRARLTSILGSLASNDLLMFRGTYNYAGAEYETARSNLNITGEQGAGLHITDPTATGTSRYFDFTGDNVKISNLTITAAGTAGSGFHQGKELFRASGSGFTVEWCKIDCDLGAMIQLEGASNAVIRRNEFSNISGFNSGRSTNSFICPVLQAWAPCDNLLFEYNYSHEIPHEHIKTGTGNTVGVRLPIVRNNFAKNVGRDFIDSTGGFYGTGPSNRAIIADNIVISCACIIDAKFEGQSAESYPIGQSYTKYVEISGNKLYGAANFIVTTLTNKALMLSTSPTGGRYWKDAIPEDILCSNNTVQGVLRMGLIKQGLNIVVSGTKRRGSVGNVRIFDTEAEVANNLNGATDVAAAIFDYVNDDITGFYRETGSTFHSAEAIPSAPSFTYGPQSGAAEPSSDPRHALVGSIARTNTDLGALSATTIMAGVWNANGAASDSYTKTVS